MSGKRLEISGVPYRGDCKVMLDGKEIQESVHGLRLDMGARDEVPRLELDLLVFEVDKVDTEADVHIAPEAHALLVRLGWTPPPEAT